MTFVALLHRVATLRVPSQKFYNRCLYGSTTCALDTTTSTVSKEPFLLVALTVRRVGGSALGFFEPQLRSRPDGVSRSLASLLLRAAAAGVWRRLAAQAIEGSSKTRTSYGRETSGTRESITLHHVLCKLPRSFPGTMPGTPG